MPSPLENKLNSFMSVTEKSKVAVVIPLFGYWFDMESEQCNEQTLKFTLDRIYSNIHQIYFIFVAEDSRLSTKVGNILAGKNKGGNSTGVRMAKGSTYGEYVRAGINAALMDTKSQYVICINPWVRLQHNALDVLIDRCNRADQAKIISGFDLNGIIDGSKFDGHIYNLPMEERGIDINCFGMKRVYAEMIPLDVKYKTHHFIAKDIWQTLLNKGFESIMTQKIPIFSFDLDWSEFESLENFEADKAYFSNKWHYADGDIKYGK